MMFSASEHVINEIILGSASVLAEKLPNVVAKGQEQVNLEKEDYSGSISSTSSSASVPRTLSSLKTFTSANSRTISELVNFRKQLILDERCSQIYKLQENFSERFDNRPYIHPHGTRNYDYKAIPEKRKEGLEKFKYAIRRENYRYLREHPEIRGLITLATKKLLSIRPSDPVQYLALYFVTKLSDETNRFKESLEKEKKKVSNYRVKKMLAQERIYMGYRDEEVETPPPPEPTPPTPPPEPIKKKQCKICPAHCICVKGKGVPRPNVPKRSQSEKSKRSSSEMKKSLSEGAPEEGTTIQETIKEEGTEEMEEGIGQTEEDDDHDFLHSVPNDDNSDGADDLLAFLYGNDSPDE